METKEKQKKEEAIAIFCIVNNGFADVVMSAAVEVGACGGTILNARGTGNKALEKFYGITISPEKEIVLIVVRKEISEAVLLSINKKAGLNSRGQGIAFALPISDYIGVNLYGGDK
ncbi:MAG: P-II family nitrogen regulator [Bacilli bacterium]|nr:P-II family nitrogen regulator [Bacilli bacterium]